MTIAATLTTLFAYNNERPQLKFSIIFVFFLIGTLGAVADPYYNGRPYKRILTAGFAAGLSVTGLSTLFFGIRTFTPLALGMWVQIAAMAVRTAIEAELKRLEEGAPPTLKADLCTCDTCPVHAAPQSRDRSPSQSRARGVGGE